MNYKFEDNDFNNCELNKSLDMSIQAFLNKKKEQYIDNDFFHQIFEIVFKYTGNYRKKIFSKEDVNFELIKDCIYIAKYYFKEGVLERSIDKILLGVIIVDFFSQNFDILEIELNRTELVKLVSNLLTSLNINIGIPDDAPYNEKKLYEVYSEAKKENEYNKVISIMDSLKYHSRAFDTFEYTWKILIQFVYYLDKNIILSTLLNEKSYEKIEILLSSIYINDIFNDIIKSQNHYLIIRSSKYFFEELEEQYVRKNHLTDIQDYTDYLVVIFDNEKLCFTKYIDNIRINYLQSYNYLMGWLLSKQTKYNEYYISHLCFNGEQSAAFTLGYNSHLTDNTDAEIVTEIEKSFFENEVKSFSPINLYSDFIDLFTYNYARSYSTREDFLQELKKCAEKIILIQNSWDFDNLQKYWIKIFYLSLSTIYTDFFFTDEEIKNNLPILFDNRNIIIQGKENIDVILTMLKNHLQNLKIHLKNTINEKIFEINKG